jgi:predicted NACHT family NTPase
MIDSVSVLLAKPAIRLVESLLKPLIEMGEKGASNKSKVAYHHIFNSYRQYLIDVFNRHSYFTSIVFKNEQKKLDDYYLPLTILKQPVNQPLNEEITITEYPNKLFKAVKRILIVDTAGMGKTTLLKYLFLCCVKQEAGIPIYIELRKLSKEMSIFDFIRMQLADLSDIEGNNKTHLLLELLKTGEFVFFLDGYDEIPENQRLAVTSGLQDFLYKAAKNNYIMTSREENSLVAFPQFQRFTIRPLHKYEAYQLLKKYADNNLSSTLIAKLEQPENAAIHEFLTNPLLTSLLYKSFEFKHIVPLKRHIFYRQVFEALYEAHDLTKEGGEYQRSKRSGMDIDKFEQVLRSLGVLSYQKDKIEFTKDELLTFIDDAKKLSSDNKATSSNIAHDLTHAVPLMVEDGNYIRWTHKSIQEYFAAQFICRNTGGKQKEILLNYLHNKDFTKHVNLIILCADIDKTSFRQSIAKKLAETLLSEFRSIYEADFSGISTDLLIDRKRLTVGKETFLLRLDLYKISNSTDSPLEPTLDKVKKLAPIFQEMEKQSIKGEYQYGKKSAWVNPGIWEMIT